MYGLVAALAQYPERLVSVDRRGRAHWSGEQWLAQVGRWRTTLLQQPDCLKVAVYLEDSAEFSALLFALWSCEREVWLAPNGLEGTVEQLRAHVDAFAGRFEGQSSLAPAQEPQPLAGAWCVSPDAAITLFTSGSSGEPKLVHKCARQLAAEVDQLERQFGGDFTGVSVLATVTHQHIYGLLFRVLWPLTEGRAFARNTVEFLEDLEHCALADYVLISSPTHLVRLPVHLPLMANSVRCVFSSGAPLPAGASEQVHERFGCDVIEVLGSTETGGMAWRVQHGQGASWRPFEVVQVRANAAGVLCIRSPFLADDQWYTCADMVRVEGPSFELLGRADRIVKIEGKRVSLEQIERALLAHVWVSDVRVQPVSRSSSVAERDELVVLLVASDAGSDQLAKVGRRPVIAELTDLLARQLERPLVPRRWRLLAKLPRNSQGKMRLADLDALLAAGDVAPLDSTELAAGSTKP
ncbi:AMP-binding protein [Simiduia aestuariiviva]|nr:AMP-binding protein [Simiduia aestuariiviva]